MLLFPTSSEVHRHSDDDDDDEMAKTQRRKRSALIQQEKESRRREVYSTSVSKCLEFGRCGVPPPPPTQPAATSLDGIGGHVYVSGIRIEILPFRIGTKLVVSWPMNGSATSLARAFSMVISDEWESATTADAAAAAAAIATTFS